MTILGKILVLLNVGLSLAMAGVALGLYSNRIDWTGAKPSDSEVDQKKLDAELKAKQELFIKAMYRWDREGRALADAEAFGVKARAWYAQQLAAVESSQARNPISVLVYQGGKVPLDQSGLPRLQASSDPNVLPYNFLEQELRATQDRIQNEIKATHAIMEQEAQLTLELNGKMRNPRGLKDLLAEMLATEKRAAEELLYVKRERINGREATASLLHRQQQLRTRYETLKKENVAAQVR